MWETAVIMQCLRSDGEEARTERDRPPGQKVADPKGLVAGKTCSETPIARLEHYPQLPGQIGTAVAAGA